MDTSLDPQRKGEERWRSKALWTLGLVLIGGNVFGLMFDGDALWAALRHRPFAYSTHSALSELGTMFGDLVLPILVVSLAPRRSFLWAAAALCISLVWSVMDRVVALDRPGLIDDFLSNGPGSVSVLLIFCGPVSLIRFLVQRSREARTQQIAEQQDWMRQAAEMQSGVWPPPIKPEGHLD